MKHLLRLMLAGYLTMAMTLVSCGSTSDYRDLLPADSFITVSARPATLSDKSGAGDVVQGVIFLRLSEELEKSTTLTDEQKEYLMTVLRTPEASGIDMDRDHYFFASLDFPANGALLDSSTPQSFGVLLPLGDGEKFDTLIDFVCQQSGLRVEPRNGVSFLIFDGTDPYSVVCAYDDRAVLFYVSSGSTDEVAGRIEGLFAQKRSESLMGNSDVASQLSTPNDINLVVSYAGMTSLFENPMLSSLPMVGALKSMIGLGSVNFEKGEIVGDFSVIYTDADSKRQIEEAYAYMTTQKGDLLRYIPKSSIAVMGFGLDGQKLVDFLSTLPGGAMVTSNPLVTQTISAFEGDMTLSFSGMGADNTFPIGTVVARVNNPEALDSVMASLGMSQAKDANGTYQIPLGQMNGTLLQFGVKKDLFYLTTDAAVVAAVVEGKSLESFKSKADLFRDQMGTIYLDFKGLSTLLTAYAGSDASAAEVLSLLSIFDEAEMYSTLEEGRMTVRMTDRSKNALEIFRDAINEVIVRSLPE